MNETKELAERFVTMPLSLLRSPCSHPEVRTTPLETEIYRIRMGRYNLVLTHEGEVLGFWLRSLPETVPVESEAAAAMTVANLRLKVVRQWQNYDCIRLFRQTRDCGVFVPAKHQNWLPLPIHKGFEP